MEFIYIIWIYLTQLKQPSLEKDLPKGALFIMASFFSDIALALLQVVENNKGKSTATVGLDINFAYLHCCLLDTNHVNPREI